MIKTILFYIFVAIAVFSCTPKNADFDYLQNVISVKGEPLPMDVLIGRPYDITCRDSLLIFCDFYDGKSLSVYDLKNKSFVGRFVSEGQGPNEVIVLVYLLTYPQKDKLYVYQQSPAVLSTLDVPDFRISKNTQLTSSTIWRPFEMQRTKDYYIGMGIFDEGRFGVYNSEMEHLYTGAIYPYKGKDMGASKAFLVYQGKFCANPNKNYFASGCCFSNHIAFYEVTENEIITIREYSSYDADVISTNNSVRQKRETIISYTWAFGTSSYCYMLFSGKTYAENGDRTTSGHYIIIFDWQGNYISTLNTDYEIRTFCVNENDNCIYAVALDENGNYIIIRLKMPPRSL